jgi:methyl-accepting chemotaxis protein
MYYYHIHIYIFKLYHTNNQWAVFLPSGEYIMKNMKLGTKLLIAFLLVGIIPFAVTGIISLTKASNSLSQLAFNQLEGVREIKKAQIEQFFSEREGDIGVLKETVGALRLEAFNKLHAVQELKKAQLEDYFHRTKVDIETLATSSELGTLYAELLQYHLDTGVTTDGPYDVSSDRYKDLHRQFGKSLTDFQKSHGLHDLFVVCSAHGHVMYSTGKEADLGSNLGHGPYRDSGLAELWKKVNQNGKTMVEDFAPYAPSNGIPAGFMGTPINADNGKQIGMLSFQLPLNQINAIMLQREGMGNTGESYLVGQDYLMRSDSYLDPEGHSVAASFKSQSKIETVATANALAGKSGEEVILDYNGSPVLSAYAPLKVGNLSWALISEIDVAEAFSPVDETGREYYAKYIEKYGYYDLFLFNSDGYAFYTAAKEMDFQTNFATGKYANSNLGSLFREVAKTKKFGIADFSPYAPSNNEPCAFIAQPVIDSKTGKTEMVIALQLSLDAINGVMQQRAGMGETGETYLIGSDKLMRSDSFLDPKNHSVKASFANPGSGSVDTDGSNAALSGKSESKIILDYNGNQVLSSYAPIKIGNLDWALMAEIDKSEALAAVTSIKWNLATIALIALGAIIAVALLIARSISRPVVQGVNLAQEIAKGDFNLRLNMDRGDEIGVLAKSLDNMADSLSQNAAVAEQIADGNLNVEVTLASDKDQLGKALQKMVANLNEILGQVQVSGEQIASGSGQVSDTSQSLSQGATEQASSLEEISASLNQLSSQTTANAENANQANNLAAEARDSAQLGSNQMEAMVSAMSDINEAGQNISKIIKTIDEIAFQTNLLALNAAVEAARAGQHGKGFAVVAEEVRNLAARSAKAAEETAELIEGSVQKTENGSAIANQTAAALQEIVSGVGKASDLVAEIAAASSEQAQGVSQINQGITQIDQVTQQNTASAEECAAAAEELSGQAEQMRQMLQHFTLKHKQQIQQQVSHAPVSVRSGASWNDMEHEQLKIPAKNPQISLDDSDFGKF